MTAKIHRNIVHRWEGNPILSMRDLPFPASDVHNAGAIKYNGEYILLITIENLRGDCSIYRARSEDGRHFTIDQSPVMSPSQEEPFATYESHGVRDARITNFDGTFYIVYLAQSGHGFRLALARTEDFVNIERIALISEPDTKNGLLFPRKINGRFARLERPREGGNIWISYSDDLVHWGGWEAVMTPRHGFWDYHRIGGAAPPIEIESGWLLFYYGVKNVPGGPLFRLGAAVLDRDNPTQILGRSNIPVIAPREPYERIGDVANMVFSSGAILSDDGSEVEIYYGAADSCICLGIVSVEDLEQICLIDKATEGR